MRALIPSDKALALLTLSSPYYFPKDTYPNINTLGVRASTYKFGGNISIQFIRVHFPFLLMRISII